jgi:chemotaxis protein MotA
MDRLSSLGLLFGFGALLGTQLLEGGHAAALMQGPAAIIVFVGTFGATCLSCSEASLVSARTELSQVFRRPTERKSLLPDRFKDLAFRARKDGLVSLDRTFASLPTTFMKRAVRHVIDGCDEHQLREILHSDVEARTRERLAAARVFETAGGYAPTMGILGAVLGLIRAMEALSNPDALGSGIAIAFVATIYGVGLANLLLLPIAAKIRMRCEQQREEDDMIIEGTLGLQAGIAPRTLERLLLAHLVSEESR